MEQTEEDLSSLQKRKKHCATNLLCIAQRGFLLTHCMVMAFAWAIAERNNKVKLLNSELGPRESQLSKSHSDLTLRKMDKLEKSQALMDVVQSGLCGLVVSKLF